MRRSRQLFSWLTVLSLTLLLIGCKDDKGDGPDYPKLIEKIDEDLVRSVLSDDGWAVEKEAVELGISPDEATELRAEVGVGGQGMGVAVRTIRAKRGDRVVSVDLTKTTDAMFSSLGRISVSDFGTALQCADREVNVTVYDEQMEHDEATAKAVLDHLIDAAK